jgi:hypothetical protein
MTTTGTQADAARSSYVSDVFEPVLSVSRDAERRAAQCCADYTYDEATALSQPSRARSPFSGGLRAAVEGAGPSRPARRVVCLRHCLFTKEACGRPEGRPSFSFFVYSSQPRGLDMKALLSRCICASVIVCGAADGRS